MGRLAEAWIAPPELRQLRELIRFRAELVHIRSGSRAQVRAVLAEEGVRVPMGDLFGLAGRHLMDTVPLAHACRLRVEHLRELSDRQVATVEKEIAPALADDAGYHAVQAVPSEWRVTPGEETRNGRSRVRARQTS